MPQTRMVARGGIDEAPRNRMGSVLGSLDATAELVSVSRSVVRLTESRVPSIFIHRLTRDLFGIDGN